MHIYISVMMTKILYIIKDHKYYVGLLAATALFSIYLRVTDTRIASWFSSETEKHSGPGQHFATHK